MRRIAFAPLLLAALALAGCQDLFTTSLGSALAREDLTIPSTLSADEAAALALDAKSDATLAAALVASLTDRIGATVSSGEVQLAAAAASAAVSASGAEAAIMGVLESYMTGGGAPTAADIVALVQTIQEGATADVVAALLYLDPDTGIADPTAVSGTVGATDYIIAAVVLAASALPEGVTDPSDLSGADLTAFQASAAVQSAADIVTAALDLVEAGSDSASLLESLAGMMQVPTT